jgi:hypothetical protein
LFFVALRLIAHRIARKPWILSDYLTILAAVCYYILEPRITWYPRKEANDDNRSWLLLFRESASPVLYAEA